MMARVFTQKHYVAIAAVIADQGLCGTDKMDSREYAKLQASLMMIEGITDRFVAMFEADSSKFNKAKFLKACGFEEVS